MRSQRAAPEARADRGTALSRALSLPAPVLRDLWPWCVGGSGCHPSAHTHARIALHCASGRDPKVVPPVDLRRRSCLKGEGGQGGLGWAARSKAGERSGTTSLDASMADDDGWPPSDVGYLYCMLPSCTPRYTPLSAPSLNSSPQHPLPLAHRHGPRRRHQWLFTVRCGFQSGGLTGRPPAILKANRTELTCQTL